MIDIQAVMPQALELATRVVGAIGLWFAGRLAIRVLARGAQAALQRGALDPTLQRWALSILGIVLNIVLLLAILSVFGVETTSFAALIAAAGIAVGAAWGGQLANFAAGLFLILFKPFRVGDTVTIADVTGVVAEIGVFSTALDTGANVRTILGNAGIAGAKIENFSVNPHRLVEVSAQLPHGVDVLGLLERLEPRLVALPGALADPAPSLAVDGITEHGPVVLLAVAARHDDHDAVKAQILREVIVQGGLGALPAPDPVPVPMPASRLRA
jgi:small conductance mechanosensitive channel